MKVKIEIRLDKHIVRRLQQQALQEGRAVSEILQDALASYFRHREQDYASRRAAVDRLCSRPFRLSRQEIDELLAEGEPLW